MRAAASAVRVGAIEVADRCAGFGMRGLGIALGVGLALSTSASARAQTINPGAIQNDIDRQRQQFEQQSAPPKLQGPAVIGGEREKLQNAEARRAEIPAAQDRVGLFQIDYARRARRDRQKIRRPGCRYLDAAAGRRRHQRDLCRARHRHRDRDAAGAGRQRRHRQDQADRRPPAKHAITGTSRRRPGTSSIASRNPKARSSTFPSSIATCSGSTGPTTSRSRRCCSRDRASA